MVERRGGAGLRSLAVAVLIACNASPGSTSARGKGVSVNPNDPTYQLFRLLDDSYGSRLTGLCVIADTYPDSAHPGQMLQHVLWVDYDKDRFFGRFWIYVRGVSQLTPGQQREYTPGEIYGFGSDLARFEKIKPGPLGRAGDLYFHATSDGALAPAPITEDVTREYELFLTQYVLPALAKR